MRRHCLTRSAQTAVEYAILIGLVTAVVLGMQRYAKRGIQAGIKMAADQMSPHQSDPKGEKAQLDGSRFETGERTTAVVAAGTVLDRRAAVRVVRDQTVNTTTSTGGDVARTIAPEKATTSGALTEVGAGVSSHAEVIIDVR